MKPTRKQIDEMASGWARPDKAGRVLPKKATYNRRLILDEDIRVGPRRYNFMFHATKGWRRRRVYS